MEIDTNFFTKRKEVFAKGSTQNTETLRYKIVYSLNIRLHRHFQGVSFLEFLIPVVFLYAITL